MSISHLWVFILGFYSTLSIYHVSVAVTRNDKNNYYYSFLVLSFAFFLFAKSLFPYFTADKTFLYTIIERFFLLISNALIILSLALFTYKYFELRKHGKLLKWGYLILVIIPLIVSMGFAFINYQISRIIFIIFSVPYGILFWTTFSISFFKEKRSTSIENRFIFTGVNMYFICYIAYPILLLVKVPVNVLLIVANLGLILMSLMTALGLVTTFNNDHFGLINLKNTLEQKVIRRTRQIKELTAHMKKFLINYSHEMKTPLTLAHCYLDEHIKLHGSTREIDAARANINKLQSDTTNFLDLEKLRRKINMFNHKKYTNISAILKEKIKLFNIAFKTKELQVKTDIMNNLAIRIDPYALDRVINNLLDNAIKYSPKWGTINVSLQSAGRKVTFTVQDTGPGLSKKNLKHIFQPYYRTSQSPTLQGNGIGLSIVKKIINDASGRINVESEKNKGTSFIVIFDEADIKKGDFIENDVVLTHPDEYDYIHDMKLEPESYDNNKKTLLIVEDNIELLAYLQRILGENYNIFYAFNGESALQRLTEIPRPDLIISDIMMNKMDGMTFFNHLQANDKLNTIPVIFLTARADEKYKINVLKTGVLDYIVKPFMHEELEARIESIINNTTRIMNETKQRILKAVDDLPVQSPIQTNTSLKMTLPEWADRLDLSERHQQIVQYLQDGVRKNKDMASTLHIDTRTVNNYFSELYKKLNLKNRTELLEWISNSIIPE